MWYEGRKSPGASNWLGRRIREKYKCDLWLDGHEYSPVYGEWDVQTKRNTSSIS